MFRRFGRLSLLALTGILVLEQLPFIYTLQKDAVYLVLLAEEGEKKSDKKEYEEKSSDDKKCQSSISCLDCNLWSSLTFYIAGEGQYFAPFGEIVSPPPEALLS